MKLGATKPNHPDSLDAEVALLFHLDDLWRRASDLERSAAMRMTTRALVGFSSALVFIFSVSLACAQAQSRAAVPPERSGQAWLTNYYGKTLSSLGQITTLRIERGVLPFGSNTNWTHRTLWEIIEQSQIQDTTSMGVAVGLAPVFSIEYASGLRVRADHYTAAITLPDGRVGSVILAPPPNPQGGVNGRQPLRSETNRVPAAPASRRSP
jgi:hypothetical protein